MKALEEPVMAESEHRMIDLINYKSRTGHFTGVS